MTPRSTALRLHDMLESVEGIETAIAGKTYRDYQRSWLLRSGIERGMEIISEASRHLADDLKSRHPEVRWKDISGIGNILRHDYHRIESRIIWQTVKNDLGPLKRALLMLQVSITD